MNRKIYNEYVTILGKDELSSGRLDAQNRSRLLMLRTKAKRSIRKDAGSYYDAVQR